QHALVEPDVGEAQELLGQADDALVEDHAVEGTALERKRGHDGMRVDAKWAIAVRIDVARELLGGGEELWQRVLRRRELLIGEDAAKKAPSVLLPLGLLACTGRCHALLEKGFQVCTWCQQTTWGGSVPSGVRHWLEGGLLTCRLTTWYSEGPANLSGPKLRMGEEPPG